VGLRGRFGVFGIRDFTLYWSGGLLSNIGTWLQNIAASAFMYEMTGSPLMVGLLNFAGFLPILVFSLFGGVVSDRYDRRRVIVTTHGASMLISFVVAWIAFTGAVAPWALIMATIVSNTAYALAKPSLTSLLPALVPRDRLAEAVGLNLLQFTGGQLAGSLLAAAVLVALGPAWAFLLNGLTFLGPAAAVLLISNVPRPDASAARRSGLAAIAAGLGYVRRRPDLRWSLAGVAATSMLAESLRTLSPVLATQAFAQPESAAGIIVAAWGAGSAVSIVGVARLARRAGDWRVAGAGGLVHGAAAVGLAVAPGFGTGLAAAFLLGIGYSLAFTVFTARLQTETDDAYRGRVMSLHTLSHLGLRPFNAIGAGTLAALLGVHAALALLAVAGPIAMLAAGRAALVERNGRATDTAAGTLPEARPGS